MNSRFVVGAVVLASLAFVVACGSDAATDAQVQSTTYVAVLNGSNEVPPRATTATGTATYVLTGNTLTFNVVVNGLTGPATAAHIHVGSAAVAGGVIVGYVHAPIASGVIASGTLDLTQTIVVGNSSVTGDSLRVLLNNGNAYTNVHTATYGGGEVRGQIIKQ